MRTRPTIVVLLLLAALSALALLVVLPRANAPARTGDAADARGRGGATNRPQETAIERRNRLMPGPLGQTTPMRAPVTQPTIERMLLPQVRRAGHVGVYRTRPPGYAPVAIVLHATGGGTPGSGFASLEALGAYFAREGNAASHYAIDRSGRIMQYVDDRSAAFHVATPGWNDISIGIELINDNTGADPFPPAQLRAARRLVQLLGERHGIPVEAVVRHRTIQPTDRSDPASNFPWETFIAQLGEARTTALPRSGRLAAGVDRLPEERAARAGSATSR